MSPIDIGILIILLPFLVQGIRKGFVSQLTALLSIVLGIWMAFKFSSLVTGWIQPYLQLNESILKVVAFILVLVAVVLILFLIGKMLEKILKMVMLGWLDKVLGVVLALLKGFIIIGLLIVLFNTLNTSIHLVAEEKLNESILYPTLKDVTYTVFPYLKDMLFPGGATPAATDAVEVKDIASSVSQLLNF